MSLPEERTYCSDPFCDGDHQITGQSCRDAYCPHCGADLNVTEHDNGCPAVTEPSC